MGNAPARQSRPILIVMAFLAGASVVTAAYGQDPDSRATKPSDDQQRREWRQLVDRQAEQYKFFVGHDRPQAASTAKAILRWANQTRITHFESATYVWAFNGRPVAVACVFTMNDPKDPLLFAQDFHSLWPGPIKAERDHRLVWYPTEPGSVYQPIPDSPPPASSPARRLLQMRTLAREFSATLVRWRDEGGDREELRLLPKPLYRYETEDPEVLDGGLFIFVQGTDPEVVLLIEALRKPADSQWRYGLTRRSAGALEARHRGKLVWQVPWSSNTTDPRLVNMSFVVRSTP